MRTDIYGPCDRAIKALNREIVKAFGHLKLAKFDQLNVIREVTQTYRTLEKKARERYYEVAFEAYLIMLAICEVKPKKAVEMADKAITDTFIREAVENPDPVMGYRFDTETERKAQRLIETLSATPNRNEEIDRAMRAFSKQIGQMAIAVTDLAAVAALEDAGEDQVMWLTMRDERVCAECGPLHGKVFRLSEVPTKPHWGCRCRIVPVRTVSTAQAD